MFLLKFSMRFLVILLIVFASLMSFCQEDNKRDSLSILVGDTSQTDDMRNMMPAPSDDSDIIDTESQTQDISGLLMSSKDVFNSIAGYNFSGARFRIRGYGSEKYVVMMNGVEMNNPENNWAIWSLWGGLNDITRYQNVKNGISASQQNFGGVGGSSNIQIRASQMRKTTKLSYAFSNRSYSHRVIFTESTGLMDNGLAVTFSGSIRYADEGYIQGTSYNAGGYFLAIEKTIGKRHSFGLTGFGSPSVTGRKGISTQEAYDLMGDNFYNPYWGFQTNPNTGEREKRNAKERRNHSPNLFLTHYFEINKKSNLNSTLYYQFGKSGATAINWYDANDPRPDYYKYLPSYYEDTEPEVATQLTDSWQNDETHNQLNWDHFYFSNSKNLFSQENVGGVSGAVEKGNRAKYIIEEARTDPTKIGFNTNYFNILSDKMTLSAGLNMYSYKSKNFKVMDDLLGADFWVDINQFAERDSDEENAEQNNLEEPNRIVGVGDVFGYNYDINVRKAEIFSQLQYTLAKLEVFGALNFSNTSFWREGHWQNGIYPNNSKGVSDKQNFFNFGGKGGVIYKLSGRHYLTANGAYITNAPTTRNAYVSARTRDQIVDGLENSKTTSFDGNYVVRYPGLKARLTYFYTQVKDQTWSQKYYHETLRTFINYNMTGVDNEYSGIEFAIDGKITQTISASGAFTKANYIYTSRPTATITADNTNEVLATNRKVYFKNFRIGGMPQTAASLGLKYSSPKYWWLSANFNYFADIYLNANPDRRTEKAIEIFVDSDPQVEELINQTKFDNAYTLNLSIGKSWRINYKYFININVNVSNVLNNTDVLTGGYENARFDPQNLDKFDYKLGYMYGRTYFAMISFRF